MANARQTKVQVRFCENAGHGVCNWLIDPPTPVRFVRHVGIIGPFLIHSRSKPGTLARLEAAKHWLFYSLLRLRLPLKSQLDDPEGGLAFDFLADVWARRVRKC